VLVILLTNKKEKKMGLNLENVKKKLEQESAEKQGNVIWKITEGVHYVRIVPVPDLIKNDNIDVKYHQHYNVGKSLPFTCNRKQYDEECAVCEYVSNLYKSGIEEDRKLASRMRVKERFFVPVLVRGQESEGIKWWGIAPTTHIDLYKIISETNKRGEIKYGDITDPETGWDLKIDYGKEAQKQYCTTKITPEEQCSILEDMSKLAELIKSIPKLESILVKKTSSEVEMILNKYVLGTDNKENSEPTVEKEKQVIVQNVVEKTELSQIDRAFLEMGVDEMGTK